MALDEVKHGGRGNDDASDLSLALVSTTPAAGQFAASNCLYSPLS
jgi:hypothetical protein